MMDLTRPKMTNLASTITFGPHHSLVRSNKNELGRSLQYRVVLGLSPLNGNGNVRCLLPFAR